MKPAQTRSSPVSPTLVPAAAVLRAEARLFIRELGSLFWILLFPAVLLCILGAIPGFREGSPDLGGLATVDLYAPVAVLLSMIMAAVMAMPSVVSTYREAGVLRRLRTTPVQPWTILAAQVFLHAATVAGSSVLLLGVGRIVFGTPLPLSWSGYTLAYGLALLATFSLGAAVTAVARSPRSASILGSIVFFGSMFTAGVYFPVQAMGGVLRQVVQLTPLGAASEAMNAAMLGSFPEVLHLVVVLGWTAALVLVSVRAFRWE